MLQNLRLAPTKLKYKMNELDLQTEIFESFGEKNTCAICQDDIKDGDQIRAISKCQHGFHMSCIDKWLSKKGECPLCRAAIIDVARVQEIYNNISRLHQELPVEQNAGSSAIINHIKAILDSSEPLIRTVKELNRYILTFCIVTMNSKVTELNGVEAFPIDKTVSLKKYKDTLIYEIRKRSFWTGSIYAMPQVKAIRQQLK